MYWHSYIDLPALVTRLPWRRLVLHQDGSRRVSDRFPGALGRNPTRRTGRYNLRYGLDLSLLPAVVVKLLTDLGKIEQTVEARMWLFTVTAVASEAICKWGGGAQWWREAKFENYKWSGNYAKVLGSASADT